MDYEVVIVGGGVVGLACAMELSKTFRSVLLIERHESFGRETSSRNSEVIHAGMYYPTGSLKSQLCVKGNKFLYEWCEKKEVPHKRIGKYIIAVNLEEEERLDAIFRQGKINGVDIAYSDIESFRREEPYIKAVAALWSPNTGIIDSHSLMKSLVDASAETGCDFAWKHELVGIDRSDGAYTLTINEPGGELFKINCRFIINAGGLDSDTIAALAGIDVLKADYKLNYSKGHYFRISHGKSHLAKHLIYPVPLKKLEGLGIHITIDLNGGLKLGPDNLSLNDRELDYSVPPELIDKFYTAASAYIDGLEREDIYPDQSGIRPKLQKPGEDFRDFIISEESARGLPGFVNLIGIESPGLTCCLSIAEMVRELLIK
jgi:L-2-hydroxyglutarate oxidase LhgO